MLETPRLYDLQPIAVEAVDPDPCTRCGSELPPHAVYCIECGVCLLDLTGGGTVIARLEDFDLDIDVEEHRQLTWTQIEVDELIEDMTEELQDIRGNTNRYRTITQPVAVLPARTGDTVVAPVPLAG